MTYYRKYRPQSLDQLIGQEHIKLTLKKAFEAGKLAHAYLFCGPRGTGKTSTARILAKMVNCESVKIGENQDKSVKSVETIPCNKCASCVSITDGSNLDLIEIDAASNRGIDDIRELREKIRLAPSSSKKKVYIIDEVHMLTTEAFNALLKTLEEPPEHALFILATTEVSKVPQTILSRVQKFDFKLADINELVEALERVVKEEKLEVEKGALELIAAKAEGGFRDGLKILDQLASGGEKVTPDAVETILRSGKFEDAISILTSIAKKDGKEALEQVGKLTENGINIKEFISSLTEILRLSLLIKHQALKFEQDLSKEKQAAISKIADQFRLDEIIKLLNSLQQAQNNLKFASIPELTLEIVVVENTMEESRVKSLESSEVVIAPVILGSAAPPESADVISSRQAGIQLRSKSFSSLEDSGMDPPMLSGRSPDSRRTLVKPEDDKKAAPRDDTAIETESSDSSDRSKLLDKWTYILETIKPYNYSLEALLKQVKVLSVENGDVVLEVPYSFHQRILEAPKSRNLLESVLADVLGKPVKVSCVLGVRPVRVEELANVELAADDEIIKVAAEIFNS